MSLDWTSEPVSQLQLNVVLMRVALVMVSVHSNKTLRQWKDSGRTASVLNCWVISSASQMYKFCPMLCAWYCYKHWGHSAAVKWIYYTLTALPSSGLRVYVLENKDRLHTSKINNTSQSISNHGKCCVKQTDRQTTWAGSWSRRKVIVNLDMSQCLN